MALSISVTVPTLLFGYFLSRTIYNLFFHPLAKIPGPFFAKISRFPGFYHAIKGDRHLWIWQCHQIYGDKIRVQPNQVLFLSQQAHRDIYNYKANVRRAKTYEAWKTTEDPNTGLTVDPAAHARKRKVLNQAFTGESVKHAASFAIEHTDRWIDLLVKDEDIVTEDGWSKLRNMSDWTNYIIFDILGDICFGRSFEIKEPGPNPIRAIPDLVLHNAVIFYAILQSPLVEFVVWAKPKGLDNILNMIAPPELKTYYDFINDSVARRIKEENESTEDERSARRDMFHYLCKVRDPITAKPYSEDTLKGEALLLVVAGSDTTSTILSAFWFYISRNKSVYTRLVNEIRSTFASSDEIVGGAQKLQSCTYVWACIDECLRISPAGPSELARETLSGGHTIDGEHFPAGIVVGCGIYAMGRNEEIFGDPTRFRPERYVPSEATGVTVEDVNRLKASYHPFLTGPTNCVGKNIAMTEMALIICRTLFRLDVRSVVGEDLGAGHPSLGWGRRDRSQYQIADAFVSVHKGPLVQFRKRSV
ncbi:unnamed protein product [Periconia digitata]|uniref:Benzoate 4-monooxygenase cytochrome P450 n=1 Tax=Periconia digitata TaxID=1303443 RepID=A0A9W4U0Y1_9PLEO|nr:unnamed protein product [Periconia digitata]